MSRTRSIASLQRQNARCRRCLEAGFPIVPRPVFAGRAGQRAYLYGLAPGRVEAETGLPWQGRAGRTLRRWLGWRRTPSSSSSTAPLSPGAFPGRARAGAATVERHRWRRPSALRGARTSCASSAPRSWSRSGLAAARQLLGVRRLTDAIGKSYVLDDAIAIPLPHPSGASGWLNDETNRRRLGKALTHVRRELERLAVA